VCVSVYVYIIYNIIHIYNIYSVCVCVNQQNVHDVFGLK